MIQSKTAAWIVGAVLALLTAAVTVQGYFLYQMQRHPQTLSARQDNAAPSAIPKPPPRSTFDDVFSFSPFGDDWDPFAEMERMREQMMRMFDDSFGRLGASPLWRQHRGFEVFAPQMDLEEKADAYVVRMDIPGAEKGDISVNIEGQTLTVSGKTSELREEKDRSGRVLRQERRSGRFQRTMTLPGPVQPEKMEATYKDGVLTVSVPKAEKSAAPRRVTIL
jgi:HSP20 family protein